MRTKILRCQFLFVLLFLGLGSGLRCSNSFAMTPENDTSNLGRLSNPFLLPQTGLFIGQSKYTIRAATPRSKISSYLDNQKINTFGFDIEVNSTPFLNIGGYFRFTQQSVETAQDINHQFQALLGGFTRFFYTPSFLHTKKTISNLFARLDLGGGPVIYGGSSAGAGMILQSGVHFGFETYFSKWFGIGFSYGRLFEFGKETLAQSSATLANQAEIYMLTLKTTVF